MASMLTVRLSPSFPKISAYKSGLRGRILCNSGSGGSSVLCPDRDTADGSVGIKKAEELEFLMAGKNGYFGSVVEKERRMNEVSLVPLEVLWDDGYGSVTVKDYLDLAREIIKPDGGPPRWFSPVECGRPLKGSPLLLFVPGIDGVGLGLIMHHKALGKVFEVRCLHIPVYDRTPFEGLVEIVEQAVREEHASSPNKPIYLVGESFGGCLALAVAARNPTVDLVLILANPATSLNRSPLRPLFPILEALSDQHHSLLPYLFNMVIGEPVKMAMVNVDRNIRPTAMLQKFSENLSALLPRLSVLSDIIPKDTLIWKLELLKSAAAYTNSRLHAVRAEVLVLTSGKDNMLPSVDEARRLSGLLKNCEVRTYKDNGHTLLLEDGINLLTILKTTSKYRRARRLDFVTDFVPPSLSECKIEFDMKIRLLRKYVSPVLFSTLEDGKIVRGLAGIPNEGPVLLVGYHMLMGWELACLMDGFIRERKILVRGLAHPEVFEQSSSDGLSHLEYFKVFGATPVSASNFFKLLSTKSYILLYPGGAREALHRKGEEYKLFWPDRQEFVRMAAKFGATIVPFGVVGEDDIVELVLDSDDFMRIPVLNDLIRESSRRLAKVRTATEGDVTDQNLSLPGVIPKLPGRFYYLFGRPIETRGKRELLQDKERAEELYVQIKSEVESSIAFLLKKRKEDPCRNLIDRTIHCLSNLSLDVPTFSL